MKFSSGCLYHVYNQGNNREKIFLSHKDYLNFLKKFKSLASSECEVISYCLMPNHFHFLIRATCKSSEILRLGNISTNRLSNAFRLLLSEYAQDFNKLNNRSGSLFRQKTKAKALDAGRDIDSALYCFDYIHNNPSKAGLVSRSMNWEFSSLRDYLGLRNGKLCDKTLGFELLGIDENYVKEMSMNF